MDASIGCLLVISLDDPDYQLARCSTGQEVAERPWSTVQSAHLGLNGLQASGGD